MLVLSDEDELWMGSKAIYNSYCQRAPKEKGFQAQ